MSTVNIFTDWEKYLSYTTDGSINKEQIKERQKDSLFSETFNINTEINKVLDTVRDWGLYDKLVSDNYFWYIIDYEGISTPLSNDVQLDEGTTDILVSHYNDLYEYVTAEDIRGGDFHQKHKGDHTFYKSESKHTQDVDHTFYNPKQTQEYIMEKMRKITNSGDIADIIEKMQEKNPDRWGMYYNSLSYIPPDSLEKITKNLKDWIESKTKEVVDEFLIELQKQLTNKNTQPMVNYGLRF